MRATRALTAIEAHAEGEQGTCYLGSVFEIPGLTMREKLRHINEVDDSLRKFLCFEPRGRPQASANLVFPSTDPAADAGFVVLQADRAHAMSGSNAICVVTALLETGAISMHEPETVVTLETAAGLIRTVAECRDGRCERVTLDLSASFVEELDVTLEVPGIGPVVVDVAFGGCYYVLVDPAQFGLTLDRNRAREIVDIATKVSVEAQRSLKVQHPTIPEINFISYVMMIGGDPATGRLRGSTVLSGRVDRSPCGTGNGARLATMAARGLAHVGSEFVATSLIDSEFIVSIVGTTTVGDRPAILPRISGRGWVVGSRTVTVDPSDPYQLGYVLSDIWGDEIGEG